MASAVHRGLLPRRAMRCRRRASRNISEARRNRSTQAKDLWGEVKLWRSVRKESGRTLTWRETRAKNRAPKHARCGVVFCLEKSYSVSYGIASTFP